MAGGRPLSDVRDGGAVLLCGEAGCVGALTLADLARLYVRGALRLVSPGCTCGARPGALEATLAGLDRLLRSRGLPALVQDHPGPKALARLRRAAEDRPDPARRSFFRRLAAPVDAALEAPEVAALARLQAIGADRPGALFAHVPVIDPGRCTGCDVCITACPEGALTRVKNADENLCYRARPDSCTGCGLCSDLCDQAAIEIATVAARPADLPLTGYRCRGCGVEVHVPTAAAPAPKDPLCRICRVTDHRRKLFQVLT